MLGSRGVTGGLDTPHLPENHKALEFLSNTGQYPLDNHKYVLKNVILWK